MAPQQLVDFEKIEFFDHSAITLILIDANKHLDSSQQKELAAHVTRSDVACRAFIKKGLLGRPTYSKRLVGNFIIDEFVIVKSRYGLPLAITICFGIMEQFRVPLSYLNGDLKRKFKDFDTSGNREVLFLHVLRALGLGKRL